MDMGQRVLQFPVVTNCSRFPNVSDGLNVSQTVPFTSSPYCFHSSSMIGHYSFLLVRMLFNGTIDAYILWIL